MFTNRLHRATLALGTAAMLSACSGNIGAGSLPASNALSGAGAARSDASQWSPDTNKTLYVASRDSSQVFGFPLGADGNVKPTVTIGGPKTKLGEVDALAVDSDGQIYAANDGANKVLVFPKGAHGNVAPKVLGGSKVPIVNTEGVAIDLYGQIYVSDYASNAIYVWKKGAVGNVAPIRTISGASTLLGGPCGMAFDSANTLYVANAYAGGSSSDNVLEFANAANGDVAPLATLGGSNTHLNKVFNVSVDRANRVIAAGNGSHSVEIFSAGAVGDVAPAAVIAGSKTRLTNVTTTGVDTTGKIYATTFTSGTGYDAVLVFNASADGNVKPLADISGSKTGINEPLYPTIH